MDQVDSGDLRSPLDGHVRDILDSLPNGLVTVDSDWRVTSMNLAAQRLLGLSEAEASGRLCRKVMRTDGCIGECPLRRTLETGQAVFDYEVTAQVDGGPPLRLAVNTAVLRDGRGSPIGGVISFRDVTLQKGLAEELVGRTDFHGLIGHSRAMRDLYRLIEEVAESRSTVLITGESGTGKELVARAIQRLSPRRERPFVRVNCAAFAESLLESELFGHVRGAYTDAHQDRSGRFERADGGTIFLDEIGEASPGVQMRLLRVLQEHEFERVGGNETIRVDVRVIAATHRPVPDLIDEGRFRADLYYRLNVIPVVLPPLRERVEDIPALAEHFMKRHAVLSGRAIRAFSSRAAAVLIGYPWPGNVRELENAVEHACVRCRGSLVQPAHLPGSVTSVRPAERAAPDRPSRASDRAAFPSSDLATSHGDLLRALHGARWNRGEAAQALGISRTTLWRRMVRAGLIDPAEARGASA